MKEKKDIIALFENWHQNLADVESSFELYEEAKDDDLRGADGEDRDHHVLPLQGADDRARQAILRGRLQELPDIQRGMQSG